MVFVLSNVVCFLLCGMLCGVIGSCSVVNVIVYVVRGVLLRLLCEFPHVGVGCPPSCNSECDVLCYL